MIEKFFASVIANVSEQVLIDLFRAIVREIMLSRKKSELSKTVMLLREVIEETLGDAGLTENEKNERLSDAGRAVVDRLRKP